MKKLLSLLAVAFMTVSSAMAQYYYIANTAAATNPGAINVDNEYPVGGGLPAGWTQINASSTNATPVWSPAQTIPFTFLFNGNPVTQFMVSSSAILTFDVTTGLAAPTYTKATFPSALIPNNSVGIWGLASLGTNDNIVTKTFGTAPNRQLWIQFSSYGYGTTASDGSNFCYWSIVLEETSNRIYVVDQRTGGYASTKKVSIGVQIDATNGVSVTGSPNVTAVAGTDPTPADNGFYEFIQGTQPAAQARLNAATCDPFVIVPGTSTISGEIKNMGANTIGPIDIKYEFNGTVYNYSVSNLSLASGQIASFTHNIPANITNAQAYPIKVWVDLAGDADHSDDTLMTSVSGLSYQTTKRVLIEEATGTWCGWCPRGAVYTEQIDTVHPDYALVVAVHNSDPMANAVYDAGMGTLISGYPSGAVDRKDNDVDPTDFEASFQDRINDISPADIGVSAYFNAANRQVDITVSATFATDLAGDYRLNAILVEDDVTGTTSAYAQTNYYSSTSQNIALTGAGHNWQTESNPVPAASMHYNFVGRDILGGWDGANGSLPSNCTANSTYTYNFTTTIPAGWDESQMRVIGILQDASTGHVLNANRGAYGITTSVAEVSSPSFSMSLYPNPASSFAQLEVNLVQSGSYAVEIFDMMGKSVYSQSYSGMSGKNILPINTRSMESGMYLVRTIVNGETLTQRLVVR
ncbi:MAG: Omp28-related outer membrane protein [Bacteroidia bacterium]